jgi:hypothetical protein
MGDPFLKSRSVTLQTCTNEESNPLQKRLFQLDNYVGMITIADDKTVTLV